MKTSRAQIRSGCHRIPTIRFGRKVRLTSYAGLVVFQALFRVLGLRARLRDYLGGTNGRVYGLWRVFLLVVVHLLLGFRRLRELDYYREDPLVARVVGVRQLPVVSTVSRTLSGAGEEAVDGARRLLQQLVVERVESCEPRRVTLDYDGMVQSTKGHAEGTAVGFNKRKKGARSYYPLFATVAQLGQYFDVLHRSGNVHDSNGVLGFVADHVKRLSQVLPDVQLEARFDAAFFADELVQSLDEWGVEFTISVPFNRFVDLKSFIEGRRRWRRIDNDWSYFEKQWKPKSWDKPYRFVFYRQRTTVQHKGPVQLDVFEPKQQGFQYKVVITNKPRKVSAADVLAFHNGRGGQEKLFGEASQHAALNVVLGRRRVTNELFTLAGMMAHNLGRELQMQARPPTRGDSAKRTASWFFQTLGTLRQRLLHRAGRIIRPQGELTLVLNPNDAVRTELRSYLDALEAA